MLGSMPAGIEKPDELIFYEQVKETELPLVAGGLMDQPHIWLLVYGLIRNELQVWSAINGAKDGASSTS